MRWLLFILIVLYLTTYRSEEMEIQMKTEQMLYSTVSIKTNSGHGSGVIIASRDGITLVLTAKHVVRNAKKPRIRVYPDETEYKATVVARSKKYDLAILSFEGTHPYVADISTDLDPSVFEKIYKVGAGHSLDPYPGVGMITAIEDDLMQVDCGVVMGDSGGPLFVKVDGNYHLVGIIMAVGMLGPTTPIYHQGYAVGITAIWDFLSE